MLLRRNKRDKRRRPEVRTEVVPLEPIKSKFKSVKDLGLAYDQNPAHRKEMEDEHIMLDCFAGKENWGYFAIYDGYVFIFVLKESKKRHTGRNVEEFEAEHFIH